MKKFIFIFSVCAISSILIAGEQANDKNKIIKLTSKIIELSRFEEKRAIAYYHGSPDNDVFKQARSCINSFLGLRNFTQPITCYAVTKWNAYVLKTKYQNIPLIKILSAHEYLQRLLNPVVIRVLQKAALDMQKELGPNNFTLMDALRQFQEVSIIQLLNKK